MTCTSRLKAPALVTKILRSVLTSLLAFSAAFAATPSAPQRLTFNLPAGDAAQTLRAFAEQSGREIIYPSASVKGIKTNAVRGEFTVRDALNALVAGTTLNVTETLAGSLAVNPAPDPNGSRAVPATGAANPGLRAAQTEAIQLSPFEVASARDDGYRAMNTMGATRTNVALRDLPMNIVVANSELIADINAQELNEAITYMGGVSRVLGSAEPRYSLRGFTSSAMMRNGLRTFGPADSSPDSVAVERVEIIKGPAAVMYGISEPGGSINVISARPVPGRAFARTGVQVGTFDVFRADFTANAGISRELPLYFRFDTSYTNLGPHPRWRDRETKAANVSVAWRPAPASTVTATLYRMNQSRTRKQGEPNYFTTDGKRVIVESLDFEFSRAPKWSVQSDSEQFAEIEATHRFSDLLNVRVFASENRSSFSHLQASGGAPVTKANGSTLWAPGENVRSGFMYQNQIQWTERPDRRGTALQIDANLRRTTGSVTHQLLAGFEQVRQRSVNWAAQAATTDRALIDRVNAQLPKVSLSLTAAGIIRFTSPFFDPEAIEQRNRLVDALGGRSNLQFNLQPNDDSRISTDAFLLNYQLIFGEGERGRVMAGYRFDDFDNRQATATRRTQTLTKGRSPTAGISYRIRPEVTAYAMYSQSIKPNLGSQPLAPQVTPLADGSPFDPESGAGGDLGLKFEWEKMRAAGTLAVFSVKRRNIVRPHPDTKLSDAVMAATGSSLSSLSGAERNRGLELDFVVRPLSKWQIYGGLTWLFDSEVLSSSDPKAVGLPVSYARELTSSVWNKFEISRSFYVSGGVIHKSQPRVRYAENSDSQHTRIDLGAGYRTAIFGVKSQFELQVKNLTDKVIYETFDVRDYPRRWIASFRAEF